MKKILEILKKNPEITNYAYIIITLGAGTIFPRQAKGQREKFLAVELEDGEKLAGPGDWHYKTAKMVRAGDVEKMKELAREIFSQAPRCPTCRNVAHMKYRKRTHDYICHDCGEIWHI